MEFYCSYLNLAVLPSWKVLSGGSDDKESTCSAGDWGLIPGSERSPGEGNGTHSSILAWRIPGKEEPGELQSMGLQNIGYNWVTNTFTFQSWMLFWWLHAFSGRLEHGHLCFILSFQLSSWFSGRVFTSHFTWQ